MVSYDCKHCLANSNYRVADTKIIPGDGGGVMDKKAALETMELIRDQFVSVRIRRKRGDPKGTIDSLVFIIAMQQSVIQFLLNNIEEE